MILYFITLLPLVRTLTIPVEKISNAIQSLPDVNTFPTVDDVPQDVSTVPVSVEMASSEIGENLLNVKGTPLVEEKSHASDVSDFQPVALPTDFESYDKDGNGYIELDELVQVSETSGREAVRPFVDADKNHDSLISLHEFKNAPWNLQGVIFVPQQNYIDEEDKIVMPKEAFDNSYTAGSLKELVYHTRNDNEEPSLLDEREKMKDSHIERYDYFDNENNYKLIPTAIEEDVDDKEQNSYSLNYENDHRKKILELLEGDEFVDDELPPINDDDIFPQKEGQGDLEQNRV
ncbi:uncharacterized protein LOC106460547 [Limulus polyphemus]|uniref:Uncharacterized protein LOC106460547 n=1 Tax=Limulus polyphemus TaxID=6850 RepID=A0ABM1B6C9_LIMPO|nr:uncharacterized protein LOC106460547 [Limulus polyphemus]